MPIGVLAHPQTARGRPARRPASSSVGFRNRRAEQTGPASRRGRFGSDTESMGAQAAARRAPEPVAPALSKGADVVSSLCCMRASKAFEWWYGWGGKPRRRATGNVHRQHKLCLMALKGDHPDCFVQPWAFNRKDDSQLSPARRFSAHRIHHYHQDQPRCCGSGCPDSRRLPHRMTMGVRLGVVVRNPDLMCLASSSLGHRGWRRSLAKSTPAQAEMP